MELALCFLLAGFSFSHLEEPVEVQIVLCDVHGVGVCGEPWGDTFSCSAQLSDGAWHEAQICSCPW